MLLNFNHHREITVVSANLDRQDRARLCLARKHYIRCSGRDDAQEFMEAFHSLPKNPGGKVIATQDEFTIETMMQPPRSNTHFQGQGPSSILKMGASADLAAILKFLDVANPIVTDLAFDCNEANNTTGNAITLDGIRGGWIERLYVQDAEGHMIRLQGTNRSCEDIWIVRNQGFDIDKQGIITATSKAERIHILHNHFENVDTDGASAVISLFDGAKDSEVVDNTIVGGQKLYAIEVGHGSVNADENLVAHNHIDTPQVGGSGGIFVWKGFGNQVVENRISGCRNTANGAVAVLLAEETKVKGNVIRYPEGHGIYIEKSSLSDVVHNTVRGASAGAANTYDSIHITDDGSTRSLRNNIESNILESVTASKARWGIYEDGAGSSNPNENLIAYNRIRNHQTGEISRHGTSTIVKDNPGSTVDGLIADPGDGGAIPVTVSGYVPLATTGGDDTRTLASAAVPGLVLDLYFATDNGNCVITAAAPVNQAGNNTLTFSDVGEHIRLVSIAANYEWRVVANDGVVLSTV